MNKERYSKRGNTLLVVVCIFAVILIIGTALLGTVSTSHKYAIKQKDSQQAYYAAKSSVDSLLSHITNKPLAEQNTLITMLNGKTSDKIPFRDDQGREWACYVSVNKVGDLVRVTGTSDNSRGTKGKIVGEMKKETSSNTSRLISHRNVVIDSSQNIDMVEVTTEGGEVNMKTAGQLSVDLINSHSWVKLEAGGALSVGNILTKQASGSDVTLKSGNSIGTGEIHGKAIQMESAGHVICGGRINATDDLIITAPIVSLKRTAHVADVVKIVVTETDTTKEILSHDVIKADSVEIKYMASVPPTINANKIYTRTGKFTLRNSTGGTTQVNCLQSGAAPDLGVMPEYRTPGTIEERPTVVTYEARSDITIYQGPADKLIAQYYDVNNNFQEKEIYDSTVNPNIQYRLISSHDDIYFGVKRKSGIPQSQSKDVTLGNGHGKDIKPTVADWSPIDVGGKLYNISVGEGSQVPFAVYFRNVTNAQFCGDFDIENGGFNIHGNTNGLVFGTVSYVFKQYRKE